VGADEQQRGLRGARLRLLDGSVDGVEVVAVFDDERVPVVSGEALLDVLGEGDVGAAVDRDVVVVVERDESSETEMSSQRGGLGGHALHQAAVADHRVGPVADGLVLVGVVLGAQGGLGDGEPDGIGEALREGTRRRLDARGQEVLGVARRVGAELAEVLDVVE